MPFFKGKRTHTINGVLFVALFALSSFYIASMPFMEKHAISPLLIAIVLGIFYGNTLNHYVPKLWAPGIKLCSKQLLRLAIILYGFRLSIQEVISIGLEGLLIDIFIVCTTLVIGTWIGMKILKLDRDISLLVSSGSAICGAAAVLATEEILKSEAYKATIAIATVVLFGMLSMFLYPALQQADVFGFNGKQFALFAGASIHEVAQVVVVGSHVDPQSANIAIIVKMTRVLLLMPVLLVITFLIRNTHRSKEKRSFAIPWFPLAFLGVIGFNSLGLIPASGILLINQLDIFLLTMAMAAIGMETNLTKIKEIGLKPFYLATILFFWLFGSAYFLVKQIAPS